MIPNKLDRHSYASMFLAIPSQQGFQQIIKEDESQLDTYEVYEPEMDVPEVDVSELVVSEMDLPELVMSEVDVSELVVSEVDLPELVVSEVDLPELHRLHKLKQNMEQDESEEDKSEEDKSEEDESEEDESEEDKSEEDESEEDESEEDKSEDESDEDESDEDEMDTQGKSKLDISEQDMSQLQIHKMDKAVHSEKDKVALRVIIDKFVWKAAHKEKMKCSPSVIQSIVEHLWEVIWAEVQNIYFVITPDTFRHLHRDVYQSLCKRLSCKDILMTLLTLQEPSLDTYIATTFRKYLTLPKDHSITGTFRKLFSSTVSLLLNKKSVVLSVL